MPGGIAIRSVSVWPAGKSLAGHARTVRPPTGWNSETMPVLAVIPTQGELDDFLHALVHEGHTVEVAGDGLTPIRRIPGLQLGVALGGLGKTQFAVQTQHLLDRERWTLTVCAGAAGALVDHISIGDVVVATETIEHDIRKAGRPLVPRFVADEATLVRCRTIAPSLGRYRLHFGAIASGDEDIVDIDRRLELQLDTGALAVAWEGAGGARASAFSGVPFLEVRGITDKGDHAGPVNFKANLRTAMRNVATVVSLVAGQAI